MKLSLLMKKTDGSVIDFDLGDRAVIGRINSCDLRVPLESVSRKHCEIWVEDERVLLVDLDSRNGTYHNSGLIDERVELRAGDVIGIGPVRFTVMINGEPGGALLPGSGAKMFE